MKKYIFIILTLQALALNVGAQEKLKGRVVDAQTKEPLAGAIIKIKTLAKTVITNNEGYFELNLPKGSYELQIQYLGYGAKEIKIIAPIKENLKIELTATDNSLNEVQVIGYGQITKRLSTGSISSISAKEIGSQPVTNVLSALSGRMPGVMVQTTNGLPGGNINIQIRGKGSINAGTDPLYIIDGVPFDGTAPNAPNTTLAINNIAGSISPLNNINPADIESITVLKDADATAIYGSRGSNGVVIITTKSAKAGNSKIDVDYRQGFSTINQKPKLMDLSAYLQMRREAFANSNRVPSANPTSADYAPDLTLWSQTEGTDWVDYMFGHTATATDLQGKISGGKGGTVFSINGNYRNEGTILPGKNSFNRTGIYSSIRHNTINNRFNVGLTTQFTQQATELTNLANSTAYLLAPNYPLYLEDGSHNWYGGSNLAAESNALSKGGTNNFMANLNMGYTIWGGLSAKLNAGYVKTVYQQLLKFPISALKPNTANYAQYGNNFLQSAIVEPQISYDIKRKASAVSLLLGGTLQLRNSQRQFLQASSFGLEHLMEDWGSASVIDNRSSNFSGYRYASVFARASYHINGTYLLNASFRRDGSSRFGPGNRFGNFGAIGAAWIFGNLKFVKENFGILSHGKLRASYGSTGNDQIGDYQYLSTYSSPGSNIYQGIGTMRPARISNADFRWETTIKRDLALELGFFKDKVFLSANYFVNHSKNQLVQYALPQITGFASYQANLPAVVANTGWEFSANAVLLQQNKINWSFNLNLTLPKNQLKSFENFEQSSYATLYEIGYDISRLYGYKALGLNPNTGIPQYAGKDGLPSTTPYNNFTLGKLTPNYYGGFGSNLSYANFEFAFFAQFVKQLGKGHALSIYPGASIFNYYEIFTDRWSAENPEAKYPAAKVATYDPYYPNSSANIFDTSYLRLKSLSLSYALPVKWLGEMKMEKFRLYVEGQNLLTLWKGNAAVLDPESGALSSGLSRNTPPLRTLMLGISLTL
ncbi:SusC/RagA family TonB-linked outer membrane protein [Pedobacter sp. UBA4863]|uniref:SusC/RagA family TonB-linked outer membrane protein n=1 Tax=Pedobacter sp. UBA4863 TaxID=1947060 RepID=UPI0025ECEE39|nr:SusC/RagA family TonB-linked outer membrane protein [Pedobacter sp. UBA4863]